jgi:bifunctional non-homologous end joining protein LigD
MARHTPLGVAAPLPAKLAPQLASLAAAAPTSGEWVWEIKFDGYRLMARIEGGKARLITRGGHDWSDRMPVLVRALEALRLESAWLDGEIVVLGPQGTPSFHALQDALATTRTGTIEYFLFDLPYLDGHDLRKVPLHARRERLRRLLEERPQEHLRYSAAFDADATAILQSARQMGLEGVLAKRRDAPYVSGRSETWLKLKNKLRQEFVVCGYRDRSSGEPEVGSLQLGLHDADGSLRHVGGVGTGWDAKTAMALRKELAKTELASHPFPAKPVLATRGAAREGALHWVRPKMVVEVEFSDWTPQRQLRHAKFIGLRSDKPAREVRHEVALGCVVEGITISNPQRVVDAASGITKLELARYYASVADRMLPHLRDRPCSLVRAPQGVGGELFYQKHLNEQRIAEVRELPVDVWPAHAPLLEIGTPRALVAAAQMNVIEFHTWNARARDIARPDRVIFDLDPGEGVAWPAVQESALLVRGFLAELKLKSWLKTSGGKGLHVVVPLAPRDDWDAVKLFSERVVQHLARVIPQRFVARSGPSNRIGKIFVDYLRNSHGATTAAAFSVRARPGLGVSMPIAWDDLASLQRSDQWNVRTARDHLSSQSADPWADHWKCRQALAAARRILGSEPN